MRVRLVTFCGCEKEIEVSDKFLREPLRVPFFVGLPWKINGPNHRGVREFRFDQEWAPGDIAILREYQTQRNDEF